jgi:autophagy-related protein 13
MEPCRSISQSPPPGPLPMEIQVLLSVPELTNNQTLVYISSDSTRVRIEPTPRFILLETWTLGMNLDHRVANTNISPPVIYKHGIILFRNVFSLLWVLPSWKFYKHLKRRVGSVLGFGESHLFEALISLFSTTRRTNVYILFSDERLSPTQRSPLPTSTHTSPPRPTSPRLIHITHHIPIYPTSPT